MSSIGRREVAAIAPAAGRAPSPGTERCEELQSELEHRLLALVDRLRGRIAGVAAEHGLTPQQAILLRHLGRPRSMGELADLLACDRSNVTGLVDRLVA